MGNLTQFYIGQRDWKTCLQRRYTNGQQAPEKMLHTLSSGNVRQSCNLHFLPTRMAVIKKPDGN